MAGCRPRGILHSGEMRRVLVDLHKTDAMIQVYGFRFSDYETKDAYYAQVLEKHGITQAQFDSSLVWYTAHPQFFNKIYPKVLKDLAAEEAAFTELHAEELAIKPNKKKDASTEKENELTRAKLDSIFWVIRHGFPHSWNEMPSMHDLEDQLFPQIGVTCGGVVDSLETRVDVSEITDN